MQIPSNDPAAQYFRSVFAVLRFTILLLVGLLLIFFSLTGTASNGSLTQTLDPRTKALLGTAIGVLLAAAAGYFLQRALRHLIRLRTALHESQGKE